ncbi:wax ester synthase/diacylglycerol acyltransferase 5 isoform X2 [Beta vulgaris subsp. vulgaris]|uniref:wax ester synthase/diacylglycerol acyltransferase 5 isoform X2 n=1 Tax=Beta vulgaris subsp. vulgaris TaxID=3555 RepID=UPI002546E2EC|nr:wax ester synthase/diacylglycerol acyltransferase 5 isoform X2 [Beta vulgaris subsp. vulgaris]
METTIDEPVTPAGRLFLQPNFYQIINCALGFKHPLDIQSIKSEISNSLMVKHPRFSSLFVVDKHGREYWRRTQINLDDHIIIHPKNNSTLDYNLDDIQEEKINAILSDFAVSSPLSNEKPLWEVHLISDLRCVVLRIHHSLGDGISLMSLFLASCKSFDDDKDGGFSEKNRGNRGESETMLRENWLMRILKVIFWTIISVMGFIGRCLWVRDKKTAVSGGDGVELWPRMVATAKFSLQDMKTVKTAIPNATINDVLFGIISFGFSKYLDIRSSHALQEGLQITGLAMVNLRKQPGLQEMSKLMEDDASTTKWGNKFGMMILPVYCHTKDADPLNYVKRAKVMIDRKKQSLEAHFSYNAGSLAMSFFGAKFASMLNHRILCNTTFTISNMVGPQKELSFVGNPITFIRATSSGLPHERSSDLITNF